MEKGKRGALTKRLSNLAKSMFGPSFELSVEELRLYPYVDFCIKNAGKLDLRKINKKETKIMKFWEQKEDGFFILDWSEGTIKVSKQFYEYLQLMLWIAYVAYEEENVDIKGGE